MQAAIQRLEGSRKKRLVNAADQARRELDASRTPQGSQHGGPRIVPAASQPSFSRCCLDCQHQHSTLSGVLALSCWEARGP